MADLAYVFVKWHGGDGAGHVAWGFDLPDGRVSIGSVENHSGHIFTPASDMGFWQEFTHDPVPPLRRRSYDDAAIFEVPRGDYESAYRVTKWIEHSAYRAFSRNCEDDAYDVLRAYGVQDLEAPFFNWLPRWWFSKLHAQKMPLDQVSSCHGAASPCHGEASPCHGEVSNHGPACHGEVSNHGRGIETLDPTLKSLPPLHPQWRKPFHLQSNLLNASKLTRIKF